MKPVRVLFVFLSVLLWSFGPTAHRAAAGFDADNVDVMTPTSAWLVGPATLAPLQDAGFSMPCIMMNQYNNGFVVRISGGGERVMAMAIDFRRDVFRAGDKYDMRIKIDDFDKTVSAAALNGSTLLFDMTNAGGMYKALRQGKYMDVSFGDKPFTFALLGVSDGLRRVEQCYDPAGARRAGQGQEVAGLSNLVPGMKEEAPPEYRGQTAPPVDGPAFSGTQVPVSAPSPGMLMPIPGADPAAPSASALPAAPAGGNESAAQAPQPDQSAQAETPQEALADKVASLDQMLASVAQKLDRVETAAGRGSTAPQPQIDIQVQPPRQRQQAGGTEEVETRPKSLAEIKAMAQAHVREQGTVPVQSIGRPLANSWAAPFTGRAKGMEEERVIPASLPGEAQGYLPQVRRWRALRGSNLREVLDVWASRENVRLIWQADRDYAVQRSFSLEGTFEQVVANLLEQYSDSGTRPTGRVYRDPDTSQKVLLIKSD